VSIGVAYIGIWQYFVGESGRLHMGVKEDRIGVRLLLIFLVKDYNEFNV
jgi:hypothetical protein